MSTEQLLMWKTQGLNLGDISKATGINYFTLKSRYNSAGIDFNRAGSKWSLDKLYNELDSEGQYVIGLLAADGYLDRRSVRIIIQERDIELLHRILRVLDCPTAHIRHRVTVSGSRQVGIEIGSVKLKKFLSDQYGFQHRKSRTLPFPRHLNNPLPFLRGFFDGDGYMGVSCTFTVGSEDFAYGLLDWVLDKYGFTPNVQMCGFRHDVFNINFRKKHAEFIYDLFEYPGLTRKTEKFLQYLPNKRDRSGG